MAALRAWYPEEFPQQIVCNQESKYVVVIVAPNPGKFQNQQETVSVAVQRTENNFELVRPTATVGQRRRLRL